MTVVRQLSCYLCEDGVEFKDGETYEGQEDFSAASDSVLGVVQLNNISAGEELSIDLLIFLPQKGQLQIAAFWVSDPSKVRYFHQLMDQARENVGSQTKLYKSDVGRTICLSIGARLWS